MNAPPVLAHADDLATVWHGDALDALRDMRPEMIDAVICDPPYGLNRLAPSVVTNVITRWVSGDREFVPGNGSGFNLARWDRFVPPPALWDEVFRVLKPGGHVLCFAAPRTQDLMGLSLRLAGFEIRDTILAWMNGSGMPKAQDLARMVDKKDGLTRIVTGSDPLRARRLGGQAADYTTASGWRAGTRSSDVTAPASDRSAPWEGWAAALKPAQEPILMARKPLDGTLAHNAVTHGTGALHIDATRVPRSAGDAEKAESGEPGRWPTNLLVVHHPECIQGSQCDPACSFPELERQSADLRGRGTGARSFPTFHYAAKASSAERPVVDGVGHLSVKPLSVTRWLVDLVAAPGMVVLDPFAGSGPVAEACIDALVPNISIEREADYIPLILQRIDRAQLRREPPAA